MKKKFLIISNIRCGATWLQNILEKIDGIYCDNELRWLSPHPPKKHQIYLENRDFNLSKYLDEIAEDEKTVGTKLLMEIQRYKEDDLSKLSDKLDPEICIIHLHRNYTQTLRSIILDQGYSIRSNEGEKKSNIIKELLKEKSHKTLKEQKISNTLCSAIVKSLYKNDLWISSLEEKHKSYLQIDYNEIPEKLLYLTQFLGIHTSSATTRSALNRSNFLKVPSKKAPNILNYTKVRSTLKTYEGLSILLKNIKHLSTIAQTSIFQTSQQEIEVPVFNDPIKEVFFPIIILIDVKPHHEFLEKFLLKQTSGGQPTSLLIIFSSFSVIKEIITDKKYHLCIVQGLLKLWHSSEWQERLSEEFKNIRTSLLFCKSIIAYNNHPLRHKIKISIEEGRTSYLKRTKQARENIYRYYQSDIFKERLHNIIRGKPPKIYLERACSSIAIKRFSDNCAKHFKNMGCDVYIHEPCTGGSIDFFYASEIELDLFKPDFCIRSPNVPKGYKHAHIEATIPSLYSMQDMGPHVSCREALEKHPLNKHDFIFLIVHYFYSQYLKAGADKEKLICDYLPGTKPSFHLKEYKTKEKYDIGYVKTMGSYLHMKDSPIFTTENEKYFADTLEKRILKKIQGNEYTSLEECASWGKAQKQHQEILDYYHQQHSLHFIKTLYKEDYNLALTGKNWDLIPNLQKYALGHAEDRSDYQIRFLDNKINLSINPWAQHHPRIFEGGICGAFFLVYYVPNNFSWCDISHLLKPGEHFDYFSTPEELVKKCRYYLRETKLRKQIGKNLQEVVKKHFSYDKLCKKILERFKKSLLKEGYGSLLESSSS